MPATGIVFRVCIGSRRIARCQDQAVAHQRQREVDALGVRNIGQRRLGAERRDQAAIERRAIRQAVGLPAMQVARLGGQRRRPRAGAAPDRSRCRRPEGGSRRAVLQADHHQRLAEMVEVARRRTRRCLAACLEPSSASAFAPCASLLPGRFCCGHLSLDLARASPLRSGFLAPRRRLLLPLELRPLPARPSGAARSSARSVAASSSAFWRLASACSASARAFTISGSGPREAIGVVAASAEQCDQQTASGDPQAGPAPALGQRPVAAGTSVTPGRCGPSARPCPSPRWHRAAGACDHAEDRPPAGDGLRPVAGAHRQAGIDAGQQAAAQSPPAAAAPAARRRRPACGRRRWAASGR